MKLIENPVEIQKKLLLIYFKSSWNFNEIPAWIIKKDQWKSIVNPVEISMKYISFGNLVKIQLEI